MGFLLSDGVLDGNLIEEGYRLILFPDTTQVE
jgi:hypothetical protein